MFWVFLAFCAAGSFTILAMMFLEMERDRRAAMRRLDEDERRMRARHANEERRLRMWRANIERHLARRRHVR